MSQRRILFLIGIGMLAAGGVLLAFGGEKTGTVLGTTLGIAGVGLIGWAWSRGGPPEPGP